MGVRSLTTPFSKRNAKQRAREEIAILNHLDEIDKIIVSNNDLANIDNDLKEYEQLKENHQEIYDARVKGQYSAQKCVGSKKVRNQPNTFLILKSATSTRR